MYYTDREFEYMFCRYKDHADYIDFPIGRGAISSFLDEVFDAEERDLFHLVSDLKSLNRDHPSSI